MKHYLAVGLAVFALCLAVSSSHFHTIDEGSMFVTAVNIVYRGELHTNQLGWAQWANRPGEEQGLVSEAGDVYSKKSPIVIALLAPLVALGRWFGLIRMALLFGPIHTALTATLLYHTARALGYSPATGVAASFAFTLTTMALPYSKLAMGELVASFGLLLSLSTFAVAASAASGDQKRLKPLPLAESPSLICGAGVALAIGANAVYVLLIPIFAAALFLKHDRRLTALISFGAPIALMGLALAGYNYLRFGSVWQTGYHFVEGQEGFSTPVWWGVLGLTISPARGFLWYNPPALLALFSWPGFHRAHRPLSWLIAAVIAMHLLAFGAWWEWWGGYGWGPRFLLPLAPCFMLICLPATQRRLSLRPASVTSAAKSVANGVFSFFTGRIMIVLIFAAGLAVQLAGASLDFNIYENELEAQFPAPKDQPLYYHHDPALVYDVTRSPLLIHFQRLFAAAPDFAWWPGAWAPAPIPNILNTIQSSPSAGAAVIYLAPELIDPFVITPGLPPTHGLPVNVSPADALAQRLFARALRDPKRVWLITWYGPADPGNWYERQLREQWASLNEETLDGYRVIQFARPPAATPQQANDSFGPIRIAHYAVQTDGNMLFVELQWRLTETAHDNYVTFVHLLAPDGSLLAGQDRQPLGGYHPTSAWQPGEIVVDRFAFPLSPDQLAGGRVEIGWYAWPSLERLPLVDSTGARIAGDSLVFSTGY